MAGYETLIIDLLAYVFERSPAPFNDNEFVSGRLGRWWGCAPLSDEFHMALRSSREAADNLLAAVASSKVDWQQKSPIIALLTSVGNVLAYPQVVQPVTSARSQVGDNPRQRLVTFLTATGVTADFPALTDSAATGIRESLNAIRASIQDDVADVAIRSMLQEAVSVVEFGLSAHSWISADILKQRLSSLLLLLTATAPEAKPENKKKWKAATAAVAAALGALTFANSASDKTLKIIKNIAQSAEQIEKIEDLAPKLLPHNSDEGEGGRGEETR